MTVWIIVFYISVGIPMVLALLAEESNQERLLILGLSLGLGAWYALVMMWILPICPMDELRPEQKNAFTAR